MGWSGWVVYQGIVFRHGFLFDSYKRHHLLISFSREGRSWPFGGCIAASSIPAKKDHRWLDGDTCSNAKVSKGFFDLRIQEYELLEY